MKPTGMIAQYYKLKSNAMKLKIRALDGNRARICLVACQKDSKDVNDDTFYHQY